MEKGKLKIFFGYSAGVGKTYAMLKVARELKKEGVDVVIGYIEPHDRPDTIKMTEGFEILPLREISYKGITLKEFDVDLARNRRPRLIMVDELAHTNAPGSKNRKRYLDVMELINNGIDVFTTVNVQHIEGLHDLVDSATSVDVNERIPDEIFDFADEVKLIDIEPSELIERMKEGKIYKKNKAVSALENFFDIDNLSALRELSMRRGADRIEKSGNNGALKTKILVLISPSPSSEKNIHVAARMAEAYHCKFSAMYVERNGELNDVAATNLKGHMRLVRDLGGELVVKYGDDVVETVADYARLARVTNLVIGKTWQSVGKKVGIEDKFIARLPNLEILIVPDNQRFPYRDNNITNFFSRIFNRRKLLKKYKSANRTLDITDLLAKGAYESENNRMQAVAEVLSRAFKRSCAIYDEKRFETSWENENIGFFNEQNELAVMEWCKKNKKTAGKGTDTLRDSKAIYLPIESKKKTVVISFSCQFAKLTVTERMMFQQIENLLKLILL